MKKFAFFLTFILLISLSACGGSTDEPSSSVSPPISEGTKSPAPSGSHSPSPSGGKPGTSSGSEDPVLIFNLEPMELSGSAVLESTEGLHYVSLSFLAELLGYEFGWAYDENIYVHPDFAKDYIYDGIERSPRSDADANMITIVGSDMIFCLELDTINANAGPHYSEYSPFRLSRPLMISGGKAYIYIDDVIPVFFASVTVDMNMNVEVLTRDYVFEYSAKTMALGKGYDDLRDDLSCLYQRIVAVKDGKTYLLDRNGDKLAGPYNQILFLITSRQYIVIENDGSNATGIIDLDGNPIIPDDYSSVRIHYPSWLYIAYSQKNDSLLFGMWDMDGGRRIPAEYERLGLTTAEANMEIDYESTLFNGSAVAAMRDGKWGVLSLKDGAVIVPLEYDAVGTIVEYYDEIWDALSQWVLNEISSLKAVIVCKDGKWGAVCADGSFAVPLEYDRIYAEIDETSITYLGEKDGEIVVLA